VSGFLGAGKTTFIKELIRRTGTCPVVLENEYGANSIDAKDLRSTDASPKKLEVLEFMEGCVCCTMKDSFANSVFTIFSSIDPEYLIIEPTGVGRLSNIINNLQPFLHVSISLLKPAVVLSPENFQQNMKEWPELYRDQVANAEIVVFSKCEHTSTEVLEQVSALIRDINPHAEIIGSHYSNMSDEWWMSLMGLGDTSDNASEITAIPGSGSDSLSGDSSGEADAKDDFTQVSISRTELHNPAELVMFLEDCLHNEFGHMARAKGTVMIDGEMLRFDLADRMYAITSSPDTKCQCVFIGQFLDEKKIRQRLCGGTKVVRKIQQFPQRRLKAAVNDIW
jgi:G3E family GTPase